MITQRFGGLGNALIFAFYFYRDVITIKSNLIIQKL